VKTDFTGHTQLAKSEVKLEGEVHEVKLEMGDAIIKVGRETEHQPTIGNQSTNDNGLRQVEFAAGRQMAIKMNPPPNLALPR
jgi:hypothetical protein